MRSSANPAEDRSRPSPTRGPLPRVARFHATVFIFYAVDGILFSALGALGALPRTFGLAYAAAGWSTTALLVAVFHCGRRRRQEIDFNHLAISVCAAAQMLLTGLIAPSIGALMLLSLMTVLASSALQFTRRDLVGTWLAYSLGSTATMLASAETLALPMATTGERLLSAAWFAWLLVKCALPNIEGTRLRHSAGDANARLRQALADLAKIATTDELTVIANRRSIVSELNAALGLGTGTPASVCVALFDIDHFKSVNDRFGHATGDVVLCEFAALVSRALRPDDRVGRYGGEEFLLVLRQVKNLATAHETVDRTRRAIEAFDWSHIAPGLRVTASAGIALVAADEPATDAIGRADRALYAAKAGGRNRVVMADAPAVERAAAAPDVELSGTSRGMTAP